MFDLQNHFKYTLYQDVRFSAICSLEITFLLKKNTNLYLSDWAIFGVDRLLRRRRIEFEIGPLLASVICQQSTDSFLELPF